MHDDGELVGGGLGPDVDARVVLPQDVLQEGRFARGVLSDDLKEIYLNSGVRVGTVASLARVCVFNPRFCHSFFIAL